MSSRNSDIECLRGVAVVGVAFHHMQGNLLHPHSALLEHLFKHLDFWFGVDLFFAISGFVIAFSLVPQMAACSGSWVARRDVISAFLIRRFWRLLPSAWLWLGLILLASITFNRSGAFGSVHANAMATLAGLGNVANFRFAQAFFHYEYGASFVYWSLSLEEQFYLLFPLLLALLQRRLALLMVALFLIQLVLIRTPLLMSVRTDALALGVWLAMVAPSRLYANWEPRFLLRIGPWRSITTCLLLSLLTVLASAQLQDWRFRITAIAVGSATLVWLASYDRDYLLQNGPAKYVLTWIGARSYAIYLIHVPAYFLIREFAFRLGITPTKSTPWTAMAIVMAAMALIAGLAALNYRYVEQPLRERGKRIADHILHRHTQCWTRTDMPAAANQATNI